MNDSIAKGRPAAARGETIGELLRRVAGEVPDRVALVEGVAESDRRRWTYAELLRDAEAAARAMLRRFAPGDRVAIWAPNIPEYQIAQYGAALAGLVVVTVNPAFRRAEARYAFEHAEVSGCFTVGEFRSHPLLAEARALSDEVAGLHTVVDLEHWEDFLADGDPAAGLPVVDPAAPAQILYTSGTTGLPKGALLAHAALTDNVTEGVANIAGESADRTVWLAVLPMFHLASCAVAAVGTVSLRGALVTMRGFDAALAVRLIAEERVSTLNIVPTLMWAMLRDPAWEGSDTSSLHSIMLGGAPIPPELARQVRDQGIVPIVGYGLTEAPMVSATSAGDDDHDLINTIGRPLPGVEMRVADPVTGRVLAIGGIGEIETRGRHTFAGYWRDAGATAAAFREDGWLRTGDLGTMDERGVVSMAGRAKEMIIRGGENVYPREIEDHLVKLDGVLDAAVIGLPDDYYGEVVAAFVRRADPARTAAALSAELRLEVTGYKVPSRWFFLEEFPLTPSGKIQKFALREGFETGRYAEEAR
ncbi:MAG: acyl--CoA ligase [Microbacteriaceae bacterium]|nr:acyl--CoA ligase [Microbacteriaceae bacterium]